MSKLLVCTLVALTTTIIGYSQTFTNNTPVAFAAGADGCISVNVTGLSGALNHDLGLLSISFDITHPDVSDFDITLTSPSGTVYTLVQNYNMAGSNYTATVIDDMGSDITDASAPYTGNFRPSQFEDNLCAINNNVEVGDGTWTLCADNWSLGAAGTINSFELTFGSNAGSIYGTNVATDQIEPSTPFICDFEGYVGYTNNCYSVQNNSGNLSSEFCGALNNNSWVSFEAANANVTLDVDVSECAGNDGVQFGVFSTPDYINFTRVYCANTVLPGANSINISGLTPGQMYYMMIDGWAGDRCKYEVTATSSSGLAIVDAQVNDTLICYGETISLTGSGASTYNWTSDNTVFATPSSQNQSDTPTTDTWYFLEGTTSQGCVATDSVFVQVVAAPTAIAGADDTLTCSISSLNLDGTGSSTGANFDYLWTTSNGNIVAGSTTLSPSVDQAGDYILTVTNNVTLCEMTDTVTVVENTTLPIANAGTANTLDCSNLSLSLDGSGSSTGSNYSYLWTTTGGNITSGNTTLTPTIDAAGTYTITVTDTDNDCVANDAVIISSDFTTPTASAGVDDTLTCTTTTINLDGSGSSSGVNYSYLWSTSNGNILSGVTTTSPSIDQAGEYVITVTNTTNGCTMNDTVDVALNNTTPTANAGIDDTLTCIITSLTLDGSGSSSGSNYTYSWTTSNGNIVSGSTSINPTVDTAGEYVITVTNSDNGCFERDTVMVQEDIALPTASAGLDDTLTCAITSLSLDGTGSSSGVNYIYLWTTASGNITSGSNTTSPTIDAAGSYVIAVTNINNGCFTRDTADVILNNTLPIADAGSDEMLSCAITSILLDGSGSSQGSNISYAWTTPDGNIVSGNSTDQATINAVGTYTLTVTDNSNGCVNTDDAIVTSNSALPTSDAEIDDTLTCSITSITLDGSGSSAGVNYSYLWTTLNGTIISGATTVNPVVNTTGVYTITVTDNSNGCTSSNSVEIFENITAPIADAGINDTLTCAITSLSLDGSGSSAGTNFSYNWSTSNGNIVSGSTTLTPTVDLIGDYDLTVTNTDNGCFSTSSVSVLENRTAPISNAGVDDTLTCLIASLNLDGTSSSAGTEYDYLWSTTNGNIVSGNTSLTPTVDLSGDYVLTVTNTDNGCFERDTVTITIDNNLPVVDAGSDQVLSCSAFSVLLDGSASSQGANYQYNWTTSGGNIVSGSNTDQATVDAAGTYTLSITNTDNGCVNSDDAVVTNNSSLPTADAGINDTLTCANTTITLNGSGSSTGASYSYNWTTLDGNLVAGISGLSPIVDQTGTYTLTVTDNTNGCASTSAVAILQDITLPTVDAGVDDTLTCTITSIALDGSASSSGISYTYNWTTLGGNIVSGGNNVSPVVDQAGDYVLEVTNSNNGCSYTDTVSIAENIIVPIASAGIDDTLNCIVSSLSLDGTSSSAGLNIDYTWSTTNGSIVSGNTSTSPVVNTSGDYIITVTDLTNGCFQNDTVTIVQNTVVPVVDAGLNDTLTCTVTTGTLTGSYTNTTNVSMLWTAVSGSISTGATTNSITTNTTGTFVYTVTNTENQCAASDTAYVISSAGLPVANAGLDDTLTCIVTTINLDGSASSSGVNYSYNWTTTNGNIVSGANTVNPIINQAGDYQITVTNTDNGCAASDLVSIALNNTLPLADAGLNDTLTCVITSLVLDGSYSSTGSNYTYSWNAIVGNITSGSNTINPTVDSFGDYVLTVTNTDNGCALNDTVTVALNNSYPIVDAGIDDTLTCSNTSITIGGIASSTGSQYAYNWTTSNGNITGSNSSITTSVDAPGTYVLAITNTSSGCALTDTVVVFQDINSPISNAGLNDTITCASPTIILDGSSSSTGSNFSYLWSTLSGIIVSGTNTLNPTVSAAGDYVLTVTNNANGCFNTDTTTVVTSNGIPSANAGVNDTITCLDPSITLNATASNGVAYSYSWSTSNGNIVSGANTLNPIVDAAGTYDLLVTNNNNSCSANSTVSIAEDTMLPIITVGLQDTITCLTSSVTLNVTSAGNYGYSWSSINGNAVSNSASLNPIATASDSYLLLTTNTYNGCYTQDTVVIVENLSSPVANAGADQTITCGANNVTVDGSLSSSGGNYSYNWASDNVAFSGSNAASFTTSLAGTYIVTVTDNNNGCFSSDTSIVVNNSASPIVVINPTDTLNCLNSVVNLDGTGSSTGSNYSYNWTSVNGSLISNNNQLVANTNQPDTFWLVVTNTLTNCADSAFTTVVLNNTIPAADAGADQALTCVTTSVSLGNAGAHNADFSYNWTESGISQGNNVLLNVNNPGVYVLTVTDNTNGCVSSDTTVVTSNTVSPLVSLNVPSTLTCTNPTEVISVISGNYGNYSYVWSSSAGFTLVNDSAISVTEPGTFNLSVTDNVNGCVKQFSSTVGIDTISPNISASGDSVITCRNPMANFLSTSTTANTVFNWTTANGNFNMNNGPMAQANLGGDYTVTVTDTINGCNSTMTLTVAEDFYYLPVSLNSLSDMCQDAPAVLLDSLANQPDGVWSGVGVSAGQFNPANASFGPQTVYYTLTNNDNGCVSADSLQFLVHQLPNVTITGNQNLCVGTPLTLTGQGATGYFWNTGETGDVITITNDSSQLIVLQGFDGFCYNSDSLQITAVNPQVTLNQNVTTVEFPYQSDLSVDTSEVDYIDWYIDDMWVSQTTDLNYLFDDIAVHDIIVVGTNANSGCIDTLNFQLNVESPGFVFIPNAFTPDGQGPNNTFKVVSQDFETVTLKIFDRWGSLVYEWHDAALGWDGKSFDGQDLPIGVYVLTVDGFFKNQEHYQTIRSVTLVR